MFRSVSLKNSARSRNFTQGGASDYPGYRIQMSHDGNRIVSAVFDENGYSFPKAFIQSTITSLITNNISVFTRGELAISGDGQITAYGNGFTGNGVVNLYQDGTFMRQIANPLLTGQGVTNFGRDGVALSANGSILAVGCPIFNTSQTGNSGQIYIYNTGNGSLIRTIKDTEQVPGSTRHLFGLLVALSDDGSIVAVLASNYNYASSPIGKIYLYNTTTGAFITSITPPAGETEFQSTLAMTSDGSQIAASGVTKKLFRFSGVNGSLIQTYTSTETGFGQGMVMSRDGSTIVGGNHTVAKVFYGLNTTATTTLTLTKSPYSYLPSYAISADGSRFVSEGNKLIQFEQLS